jgi:hypothetical protein
MPSIFTQSAHLSIQNNRSQLGTLTLDRSPLMSKYLLTALNLQPKHDPFSLNESPSPIHSRMSGSREGETQNSIQRPDFTIHWGQALRTIDCRPSKQMAMQHHPQNREKSDSMFSSLSSSTNRIRFQSKTWDFDSEIGKSPQLYFK